MVGSVAFCVAGTRSHHGRLHNGPPGTIVSSQIEYEHMQIFYHLEIENQQQELIEINISAKSGKIIGFEYKE